MVSLNYCLTIILSSQLSWCNMYIKAPRIIVDLDLLFENV